MARTTRSTRALVVPSSRPRSVRCSGGTVGRRRWLALAPCVLIGLCAAHGGPARADESQSFHVIVNADNPVASVSRDFLTDAFLKRVSRWPAGENIQAVDLRSDSPVRAQFSTAVLRRSVAAIRSYWQQRIFAGRGVPPPEVDTDSAAIHYVKRHRGGVGYVSRNADTSEVKVLALR
jgi:hypothetical protein